MPWTVRKSDECPESRPWAVVKDDDGAVEGCHASEQAANTQRAALYAQEESKILVRTTFKAVATVATDTGQFEAVISTENVDREKDVVSAKGMVDALSKWNRPIPLAWNHSTSPEHIFGHIDPGSVKEVASEVHAAGQVDLESDIGREAWRSFKSRTIGFSFGYLILEGTKRKGGGRNITALDVFEVTATPTPMNNDTRVLSTKAVDQLAHDAEKPKTDEELRELAKQVERELREDKHPELQGPPEGPSAEEKRLAELEGKIDKLHETVTAEPEQPPKSDEELRKLAKQVEREIVEKQHPELEGPPEPGPSPEEKRLAQLEGKLDAILEGLPKLVKQAVGEEAKAVVEHTVSKAAVKDPLRKQAEEMALEVASGGLSKSPPSEPEEEPVREPLDLKELKRKSRDLALEVLIGPSPEERK